MSTRAYQKDEYVIDVEDSHVHISQLDSGAWHLSSLVFKDIDSLRTVADGLQDVHERIRTKQLSCAKPSQPFP